MKSLKITEFLIHSFQQKREEAETRRNEDLRKKQTDKMPKVRKSADTILCNNKIYLFVLLDGRFVAQRTEGIALQE